MSSQTILVLGAGSWGTALALVLARNGNQVFLWDINTELVQELKKERKNQRYIPGVELPENLIPIESIQQTPADVKYCVSAVPCHGLRQSLELLQTFPDIKVCLACKGFEPGTQKLNHEVVKEVLSFPAAVLSGPSFAKEVANGLPTAVTIASVDQNMSKEFADLFHCEVFRIYTQDDVIGVQVGGAVKNVMAIAAGIADGLGYGSNTRSALITRGLAEIMRLGIALGGKQETFMGLAGLGDLVLTCTDDQSRNRRLGLSLAEGLSLEEAKEKIGQAIEGIKAAIEVEQLSRTHNIEMPITEQVVNVINNKVNPKEAVQNLLSREQRSESS